MTMQFWFSYCTTDLPAKPRSKIKVNRIDSRSAISSIFSTNQDTKTQVDSLVFSVPASCPTQPDVDGVLYAHQASML